MKSEWPTLDEVSKNFSDLLGRETTCKAFTKGPAPDARIMAVYRDRDKHVRFILTTELALACYAGAALALIPKATAQESIKANQLPDNLKANFAEILNVMSSLLSTPERRIAVAEFLLPGEAPPADAEDALIKKTKSTNMTINIEGYGSGLLGLIGG